MGNKRFYADNTPNKNHLLFCHGHIDDVHKHAILSNHYKSFSCIWSKFCTIISINIISCYHCKHMLLLQLWFLFSVFNLTIFIGLNLGNSQLLHYYC